jgi:hypothetical protein
VVELAECSNREGGALIAPDAAGDPSCGGEFSTRLAQASILGSATPTRRTSPRQRRGDRDPIGHRATCAMEGGTIPCDRARAWQCPSQHLPDEPP